MKQSPSWEASSSSAVQEILRVLRNTKVLYRINENFQLVPILSHFLASVSHIGGTKLPAAATVCTSSGTFLFVRCWQNWVSARATLGSWAVYTAVSSILLRVCWTGPLSLDQNLIPCWQLWCFGFLHPQSDLPVQAVQPFLFNCCGYFWFGFFCVVWCHVALFQPM